MHSAELDLAVIPKFDGGDVVVMVRSLTTADLVAINMSVRALAANLKKTAIGLTVTNFVAMNTESEMAMDLSLKCSLKGVRRGQHPIMCLRMSVFDCRALLRSFKLK